MLVACIALRGAFYEKKRRNGNVHFWLNTKFNYCYPGQTAERHSQQKALTVEASDCRKYLFICHSVADFQLSHAILLLLSQLI